MGQHIGAGRNVPTGRCHRFGLGLNLGQQMGEGKKNFDDLGLALAVYSQLERRLKLAEGRRKMAPDACRLR